MAYQRILDLPAVLRRAGLEVIEHPGWRERGLDPGQRFEPDTLVWHHDASAVGDSPSVPQSMINRFLVGAAQFWVCAGCNGAHRVGAWHIIASGRAPHAGEVLPGMPDNFDSVGVETDHTTGEEWPAELLRSLRVGSAAIFAHWRVHPSKALHFHKSICSPPGRKVDPDGLNLSEERQRVSNLMLKPAPVIPPPPKPAPKLTRGARIDAALKELRAARDNTKHPVRLGRIKAALKALRGIEQEEK